MIHLTKTDYTVSRWSGGATTQIAIAPAGAVYADRDFLWRVSSATVELEQSDFTPLPDYDRWIATLDGTIVLTHNGGEAITLNPYEAHFFDGGDDTRCVGRCTDFNLMLRKGRCRGEIRGIHLSAGEGMTVPVERDEAYGHTALLLFCGRGGCTVAEGEKRVSLAAGESVLAEGAVEIAADAAADLMAARVWY